MALTKRQVAASVKRWVRDNYPGDRTKTATLNTDDVKAAIESIDAGMATVVSTIPGAWGTKTIKKALLDNLPEPFKTRATAKEKAAVVSAWALINAGIGV